MLQSSGSIVQLIMTTTPQMVPVESFASIVDLDMMSDLSPSLVAMHDALNDMSDQLVFMSTSDPKTAIFYVSSKKIKAAYPNKPLQVATNAAVIRELDSVHGFDTRFEWGIELANTLGMLEEKELLEEMLVDEYDRTA